MWYGEDNKTKGNIIMYLQFSINSNLDFYYV